jgi:hypothetical protein
MPIGFDQKNDPPVRVRFLTGVRHEVNGKMVDFGPGHDGGEEAEIEGFAARRYIREERAVLAEPKKSAK